MNQVMKKAFCFAVAMVLFLTAIFAGFFNINNVHALSEEERVVLIVNQRRAEQGLSPVQISPVLMSNAKTRAQEVSQRFSHYRPNGEESYTAIDGGILAVTAADGQPYCGENIAKGAVNAEQVMNMWMNSSGHRANILTPQFNYMGVGKYGDNWVQIFVHVTSPLAGGYYPAETVTVAPTEPIPNFVYSRINSGEGDTNSDGNTDAKDATAILRNYAGVISGNSSYLTKGDVNSDGYIDAKDATFILRYYAENISRH